VLMISKVCTNSVADWYELLIKTLLSRNFAHDLQCAFTDEVGNGCAGCGRAGVWTAV